MNAEQRANALREGTPYVVITRIFPHSRTRYSIHCTDLAQVREQLRRHDDGEAEVYKIKPAENAFVGDSTMVRLSDRMFTKERKMAKETKKRNVAEDLIGISKKATKPAKGKVVAKKVVAKPAKKGGTRGEAFDMSKRIKVLKERNVREGSKDGQQWTLLLKAKTVGEWFKACAKKDIGDNCQGMLRYFIRAGYAKVI